MSTVLEQPRQVRPVDVTTSPVPPVAAPVVALKRSTIDSVLIGFGVVAMAAFAVAGGLLMWGHNFSSDYVNRELSSQNISFPSADALVKGERADLVKYADAKVDTGVEAEAYASFINGHLAAIADGATYADLGAPESAAKADVAAAVKAGKSTEEVAALQAKADTITGQRNTMFKGETLRGLLLSAYAWSTVGTIAGYAAFGAFAAAAIMLVLVVLGLIHQRRTPRTT